jgi:hypothetical protein
LCFGWQCRNGGSNRVAVAHVNHLRRHLNAMRSSKALGNLREAVSTASPEDKIRPRLSEDVGAGKTNS